MAPVDAVPVVPVSEAIAPGPGDWLLDVREQWEWNAGHAPDAHLVPVSAIGDRLEELPEDRRLLVICRSGVRSERVAAALLGAGYDAVNVEGGMLAWQAAGAPMIAEGAEPPRV